MVNNDKFSLYDTKADIHDLGVGSSLSTITDRAHANKRMLVGNQNAKGRAVQRRGIHNDRAWKGACQADGCARVSPSDPGSFSGPKAKHLVTTMVDGDVTMKKLCDKHMEEHLFTSRAAGHNLITSAEQKIDSSDTRPVTLISKLNRENNDAYRVHHGLEPETIGNVDGSGRRRKIVKNTTNNASIRLGNGVWMPESLVDAPEEEKRRRGRPSGSGDSKQRKRRTKAEVTGEAPKPDAPKRGRGRPVGSKTNPDAPKRKKKAVAPQETRMVNGREMKVTYLPEDKRATQRSERLTRRTGSNFRGKEGKGQVK